MPPAAGVPAAPAWSLLVFLAPIVGALGGPAGADAPPLPAPPMPGQPLCRTPAAFLGGKPGRLAKGPAVLAWAVLVLTLLSSGLGPEHPLAADMSEGWHAESPCTR